MSEDPETDPDSLPTSSDPGGPCPRCGRVSNFEVVSTTPLVFDYSTRYDDGMGDFHYQADVQSAVLMCTGCREGTVVVEELLIGGERGGSSGAYSWRGVHWWPPPGTAKISQDIPGNIAKFYAEGLRCLSAQAPNGAATMFRNAMTYIVEDKGSSAANAKHDLKDKIKQMVVDGALPASLGDWVTHVRLSGNAGAHPDLFGDVSTEEVQEVVQLLKSLFDVLYIVPATIARRQKDRLAR